MTKSLLPQTYFCFSRNFLLGLQPRRVGNCLLWFQYCQIFSGEGLWPKPLQKNPRVDSEHSPTATSMSMYAFPGVTTWRLSLVNWCWFIQQICCPIYILITLVGLQINSTLMRHLSTMFGVWFTIHGIDKNQIVAIFAFVTCLVTFLILRL